MLRVHLLSHLRLFDGDYPAKFAGMPKTLPLWAYLLLHRVGPIPRERLAYILWPDESEARARAKLRRHLHDLRRALPSPSNGDDWLLADMDSVQWNPQAHCWLDVVEFERLSADPARLAAAVALYTGDLLPDIDNDWIVPERERLHNLYVASLSQLIAQSRARRDWPRAMAYARQILKEDPLREEIVRDLIALLYESGDRARALQEYQRFEQLLREELGVAPMAETRALYETIAAETLPRATTPETVLQVHAAPAASPAESKRPPSNIPAQLTTFVGREAELSALRDLLCAPVARVRLLALTGPGGTGKTRLALELVSRLLNEQPGQFPDGAFAVWLAAIEKPELVMPTIAKALGLGESSGRRLAENLTDFLRAKRLLLMLDNFEQVGDAAPLVADLLAAAPSLQIVVTSRALLRVYGEREFEVSPLPLPDPSQSSSAGELSKIAAVALFVERARAVNPHFALSGENAAAVAEICARLDGLPLAIELAAARSKLFSPQAILRRLESSLAFLSIQSRDRPARQQTLRGTIDWSYNLLTEDEKRLFRRLAVFVDWFSLEAAESVCGGEERVTLDSLTSLVDKGMLWHSAPAESDAEPWFRMLFILHEYALERLTESGELNALRERHARYYLALAERAAPELRGPQQLVWLQRLDEQEHNNLRAALSWAVERGDAELGLRLAAALGWFWLLRGHWTEGREWLTRVLSLAPPSSVTQPRARALNAAALLADYDENHVMARTLYEESAALSEANGDRATLAHSLYGLGKALWYQGEKDEAAALTERSLALCRTLGDKRGVAASLSWLAALAGFRGDQAAANSLAEEALSLYRALDDECGVAQTLWSRADAARTQQDYAMARRLYEQCLPIARKLGDKLHIHGMLVNLADLALVRGDHPQVEELAGEALNLCEALGERWQPPRLRRMLGYVALHRGDHQRAVALFGESLRANRKLDDTRGVIACLVALASAALARKQHETAARLCSAVEVALQTISEPLLPADLDAHRRNMGEARAHLAPQAFIDAWETGRAMPLDAAVSFTVQPAR